MSTAQHPPRAMPATHRHHPYASSSSAPRAPSQGSRQWSAARGSRSVEQAPAPTLPPSPPRSRRDHSETPPSGLGAAFGGRDGGKWWDEELVSRPFLSSQSRADFQPQPPASLSSILDSFRRSGEGDRDLLLAILGAKKAEEERLTSLIQTRLTILQARLSVHAAADALPTPHESIYTSAMAERTPSLTSRASASSSAGPISPTEQPLSYLAYDPRDTSARSHSFHLPPPSNLWRRVSPGAESLPSINAHGTYSKKMEAEPVSPRSESQNGLDMLLDAGRRVETRVE